MKLCFAELMIALSHALDYVEHELIGVKTHHGKRVAYLCAQMGKAAGLNDKQQLDLVGCAVLHDNALTEYLQAEYLSTGKNITGIQGRKLGIHCTLGERNIKGFPFFGEVRHSILYHHEHADGSGPFSKKESEIPFYAALIHLADQVDGRFNLREMSEEKYQKICDYLNRNKGILFGSRETALFLENMTLEKLEFMADQYIETLLGESLIYIEEDYSPEQLIHIAGIFARIVDYKSTFTSLHSIGIAHKAYTMASYYGYDEEYAARFFLAGALHDIGKLSINVEVLEKAGKLTDEEFRHIKLHALITYQILSKVRGMEEICKWASFHHEKLNGKGYPFGRDSLQLDWNCRLMACLDIYQALREDRPYKKGKPHQETIQIMEQMVQNGFIDKDIVKDMDQLFSEQDESEEQRFFF